MSEAILALLLRMGEKLELLIKLQRLIYTLRVKKKHSNTYSTYRFFMIYTEAMAYKSYLKFHDEIIMKNKHSHNQQKRNEQFIMMHVINNISYQDCSMFQPFKYRCRIITGPGPAHHCICRYPSAQWCWSISRHTMTSIFLWLSMLLILFCLRHFLR